jgi:glutamine---fructose-6-phosphate transaminase (isomerizing)
MSTDPSDPLVLASLGSPLVVGKEARSDGALVMWVASDYVALLGVTTEHCYVDDTGSVTEVYADGRVLSTKAVTVYTPTPGEEARAKSKYQHAMLAEIFEQPDTLTNALAGRLAKDGTVHLGCLTSPVPGFATLRAMLAHPDLSVRFAAQGTSYYAGVYGAELFRQLTDVPVQTTYGSELKNVKRVGKEELCIALSQSGETADTRDGVRRTKKLGAVCFGMTNRPSSVIVRDTHVGLHLHAGIETAVASTKAFTAQSVCIALLALETARVRGTIDTATYSDLTSEMARIPDCIRDVLQTAEPLCEQGLVQVPLDATHAFFLGSGISYALASEAALKVQEVGYVHAHAFHLSELKHGPLALVQPDTPVYAFVPDSATSDAVGTALTIAHTNGARIYTIGMHVPKAVEGKVTHHFPTPDIAPELFPIVAAAWVQLISAYTGLSRGNTIDKPRNLAKSVTV